MNGGLEIVLQTLQQATSQIPDQFKPAELMLENWQAQPGFYSILVEVFNSVLLFIIIINVCIINLHLGFLNL